MSVMAAPATMSGKPDGTRWADEHMDRLLSGACAVDLGDGWKHFTIVACCNEWMVTAKKLRGRWAIKSMECIPST